MSMWGPGKTSQQKQKPLLFSLLLLAVGVMGLLNSYVRSKNDATILPTIMPTQTAQQELPQRVTMEGDVACLPHKDTSGSQTLECAIGLKSKDGKYYALDTNLLSSMPPAYTTGDKIRANGIITPVEALSSDHWQKYNVTGIFSVTDSFEKI